MNTRELTLFSMFAAVMFASRLLMQMIPGVHINGLMIAALTLTYRQRALIPLYLYVALEGLFSGFAMWWVPYVYIWFPLWAAFMFLGKLNLPTNAKTPAYMIACGLHGLLFGIMYAPVQALMFGLSFRAMIAWVIAGIPFDIIHAVANTIAGILILPLVTMMTTLKEKQKA